MCYDSNKHIGLPAKLLDYFLRSNKSNINQSQNCTRIYTSTRKHMYRYTQAHKYTYTLTHTCEHTQAHSSVVHTNLNIQAHRHAYIHTQAHNQTRTSEQARTCEHTYSRPQEHLLYTHTKENNSHQHTPTHIRVRLHTHTHTHTQSTPYLLNNLHGGQERKESQLFLNNFLSRGLYLLSNNFLSGGNKK